jgi:WD40 repeat protein
MKTLRNSHNVETYSMTTTIVIISTIALTITMIDTSQAFRISIPTNIRNVQQQFSFVQENQKYLQRQRHVSKSTKVTSTTSIRDSLMDGFFDINNNNSTIESNNDFEIINDLTNDFSSKNNNNDDDMDILQQLRCRVQEINNNEQNRINRFRTANCESSIVSIIPDWVRRINIGTYPIAVCGSASSTLFVTHLESGTVLASNEKYKQQQQRQQQALTNDKEAESDDSINEHTIRLLYGQYDGGGTISVAMSSLIGNSNGGAIIAEGRRGGGVGIYRFDSASSDLLYQGSIPTLDDCIATSLSFDNDNNLLWISTDNGYVYAYSTENELSTSIDDDDDEQDDVLLLPPLVVQTQPKYKWNIGSTVLSVSVNTELSCAVATAESGYVYLLSLDNYKNDNIADDDNNKSSILQSFLPPYDSTERRSSHPYCTCATLVVHPLSSSTSIIQTSTITNNNNNKQQQMYSIVCGTNDGTIYVQTINQQVSSSEIDFNNPFKVATTTTTSTSTPTIPNIRKMMPSHLGGGVKCITNIPNTNGLIASCGYDGSLRIWDVSSRDNLYQFLGYKVWIGSVWSDGYRIVSDGADNTIIQHDFSIPPSSTTTTTSTTKSNSNTSTRSSNTSENDNKKKKKNDNKSIDFDNDNEFM